MVGKQIPQAWAVLIGCSLSGLALAADDRRLTPANSGAASLAAPRVALVIGNSNYAQPLKNPVTDARAMAALLEELGFVVLRRENLSRPLMEGAIREFGDRLRAGASVGLFYYAGHGLQVDGENYLVPLGEDLTREDEVKFHTVNASLVLAKMESARSGTNIVILDACRNNPFRSYWRSLQEGLATMTAPVGTLISYATAPGKVAGDGSGDHGVFTSHLLREMRVPGTPIELVFKKVRQGVVAETAGKQVPWEATSLQGDFFFTAKPDAIPSIAAPMSPPAPSGMVKIRGHRNILDFWLDTMEVSVSAYQECVASGACSQAGTASYCNSNRAGRNSHPINCVSFQDAKSYCTYQKKRLPTEQEWMLAGAGAEQRPFPWGTEPPGNQLCWNRTDQQGTCPVGSFIAGNSPDGVRDLAGNVWEWVLNTCDEGRVPGPSGCSGSTEFPIARGGAFVDQKVGGVGIAAREATLGGQTRWGSVGFRCARDAELSPETREASERTSLSATPFRPSLVRIPAVHNKNGVPSSGVLLVGATEVTQGQYKRLMNFNPSEQFVDAEGSSRPCRTRGVGDDLPVFCVGFIDALRYANALSRMEGFSPCYDEQSSGMWGTIANCSGYRIPSEIEWASAATAGHTVKYAGSDSLNEVAWWKGNAHGKVHPVGTKKPNAVGLYDMTGNVYEWTVDPADGNPRSGLTPGSRIVRGGSFFTGETAQRLSARADHPILEISTGVGFRIVRSNP